MRALGQTVMVYGPRRYGKRALRGRGGKRARIRHPGIYVDCGERAVSGHRERTGAGLRAGFGDIPNAPFPADLIRRWVSRSDSRAPPSSRLRGYAARTPQRGYSWSSGGYPKDVTPAASGGVVILDDSARC